jgi:pilus assembly protein CpaF
MFPHYNMVFIALISAVALLSIYFIFKKDLEPEEAPQIDVLSISYLCESIKNLFNQIINQNIVELYLSKEETKKRENQKVKLSNAIRSCAQGSIGDRNYVKDYIKDLLQNNLNVNENTINHIIPFDQPWLLSSQDKYEIMLQAYKMQYDGGALEKLSSLCGLENEKINEFGVHYECSKDDIDEAYRNFSQPITYVLKIEILTQRIFQETYGFSVADETFYQDIVDGISGGVSGITTEQYNYMEEIMQNSDITVSYSYNSLWVIIHGKPIHLSFMGFGSKNELIRVCKNLYQYDNVGHLNSSNGFKLSYLQNGSRVVVTRPKLTSGWSFFVRKYESSNAMTLENLVTGKNNTDVIELTKWAVRGLLNIIISGDQNSGKTTYLKAIFRFFDQRYQIRTTEAEFELWINNLYQHLNVVSFRGTEEVSLIDAINIQKKTDGVIMILGEIADTPQANAYISLTQSGTKSTMATCHCKTTPDVIDYFRNGTLSRDGIFTNEMIAEEQVANSINLDIHWKKSADGQRYISHITEVIPLPREDNWSGNASKDLVEALRRISRRRAFITRQIIVYENGEYVFKNSLSDRLIQKIIENLSEEDGKEFLLFNARAQNH